MSAEHDSRALHAACVRDALYGLAFDARLMQDTPWYRRTPRWHRGAMEHIQHEAVRIARGDVDDNDLIG